MDLSHGRSSASEKGVVEIICFAKTIRRALNPEFRLFSGERTGALPRTPRI
jgi:hypothetical protein